MHTLDIDWRDVTQVAPRLLGCTLVRYIDGQRLAGRIVETEAYHQTDAASHSFNGQTPRTEVMFGPPGRAYVYFTYGMHYCLNVVVGQSGEGSAVLIRALEPLDGVELMQNNRGRLSLNQLTNGPAKLCQALNIDKAFNGHNLTQQPLQLEANPPLKPDEIVQTTRIGISKAKDQTWRWYIKNSPFVSKR